MILSYSDIGLVDLGVPKSLSRRELSYLGTLLCVLNDDYVQPEDIEYSNLYCLISGLNPINETAEVGKLAFLIRVTNRHVKKGKISSERLTKLLPMVPRGLIVPAGKYYSIKNLGFIGYIKYLIESLMIGGEKKC